jgi:glycosyltransferase involved in cell wall biosynthesis
MEKSKFSGNVPPLISVVVPTYNSSQWLPGLIETIRSQRGVRTEIILVDNESQDETVEQIKRDYGDLVTLRYSFSVRVSRLIGVHAASGDYVAFLDHDDLWDQEKLSKQLHVMQRDPEIFAIGTFVAVFSKTPEDARFVEYPDLTEENLRLIRRGRLAPFHISSMLLRTEDAKRVLLETLGLRPSDGAIFAECARQGRISQLKEPLTFVRILPESHMRRGLIEWSESRRRTWFVLDNPDEKHWISEREFSSKHITNGDRRSLKSQYLEVRARSYREAGDRIPALYFGLKSKLYNHALSNARRLRQTARRT